MHACLPCFLLIPGSVHPLLRQSSYMHSSTLSNTKRSTFRTLANFKPMPAQPWAATLTAKPRYSHTPGCPSALPVPVSARAGSQTNHITRRLLAHSAASALLLLCAPAWRPGFSAPSPEWPQRGSPRAPSRHKCACHWQQPW